MLDQFSFDRAMDAGHDRGEEQAGFAPVGKTVITEDAFLLARSKEIDVLVDVTGSVELYVNDERVEDAREVHDGDQIRVGRATLTVHVAEAARAARYRKTIRTGGIGSALPVAWKRPTCGAPIPQGHHGALQQAERRGWRRSPS